MPTSKVVLKTLDRALSKAGIGSRTETRSWIGAGRVAVNGKTIRTPDHWVNLQLDEVTLDGNPVVKRDPVYLLLYKPKGFLTTYKDPEGRPTVYDLMKDVPEYIVPVGRLDLDTSGLLILTNDTKFADRIMSPKFKVPKTYYVKAAGILSDDALEALRKGVALEDGMTSPAKVARSRDSGGSTFLEIVITEGRNRQVRRMLEAVGSRVRKLVRTAIGPVRIGTMVMGSFRALLPHEVDALAGMEWIKLSKEESRPPAERRKSRPDGAETRGAPVPRRPRSGGEKARAAGPKDRKPTGARSADRRPANRRSSGSDRRGGRGSR
ncbi:MAG: rRNA pseudouridine synthase [Candidatus Solibacter usitatus]|nr:rRNA pseudouridine synthase [Candidatus Solibacter usitatus]